MGNTGYRENPKRCRTPGAIYSTSCTPKTIRLTINLPVPMLEEKEDLLIKNLHYAVLEVIERVYRDRWKLLAGKMIRQQTEPMPKQWSDL